MRRKLVTLAVVALFAGCGFPSISYETAGDGSEGGTDEASADGAPHGEGSSGDDGTSSDGAGGNDGQSADTGGTSSGGDASSGSDSPAGDAPHDAIVDVVFEAAPDANPCDQDGDGYLSNSAECKGNDCCDIDKNANIKDTQYWTVPDNCGSYDYNCNGTEDDQYPVDVTCTGTGLTGCGGGPGFQSDTGCGQSGEYGTCEGSGALKCTLQDLTPVTQGCR